jgi:hypothetical protein
MKRFIQVEDSGQVSFSQFQPVEPQSEASDSTMSSCSSPMAPPFDEPIYTINEVAKILQLSPNQVRTIFRNEPGVHDLSNEVGKSRFRRRSQLRIPHAVLTRFWKRTEIREQESKRLGKIQRFEQRS